MFCRYFREWVHQYHHVHPTQLETIKEVSEYIYFKLKVILIVARTVQILRNHNTSIYNLSQANHKFTSSIQHITAAKQLRKALASTAPISPTCSQPSLCPIPRTPLLLLSSLWDIASFPKFHMAVMITNITRAKFAIQLSLSGLHNYILKDRAKTDTYCNKIGHTQCSNFSTTSGDYHTCRAKILPFFHNYTNMLINYLVILFISVYQTNHKPSWESWGLGRGRPDLVGVL